MGSIFKGWVSDGYGGFVPAASAAASTSQALRSQSHSPLQASVQHTSLVSRAFFEGWQRTGNNWGGCTTLEAAVRQTSQEIQRRLAEANGACERVVAQEAAHTEAYRELVNALADQKVGLMGGRARSLERAARESYKELLSRNEVRLDLRPDAAADETQIDWLRQQRGGFNPDEWNRRWNETRKKAVAKNISSGNSAEQEIRDGLKDVLGVKPRDIPRQGRGNSMEQLQVVSARELLRVEKQLLDALSTNKTTQKERKYLADQALAFKQIQIHGGVVGTVYKPIAKKLEDPSRLSLTA